MCKPAEVWNGVLLGMLLAIPVGSSAYGQIWTGLGDGETWSDGSNWDAGIHPQVPGNTAVFDGNFGIASERIQNTSNIAISVIEVINSPGNVVIADDEPFDGSFDFELDNGGGQAIFNLDASPGYSWTFAEGQPLRLISDLKVSHSGTPAEVLKFESNVLGGRSIDLQGTGRVEITGSSHAFLDLVTDVDTQLGDASEDFFQVLGDVQIGLNSTTQVPGTVANFANLVNDGTLIVEPRGLIVATNDLIGSGNLDVLGFGRVHVPGSAGAFAGATNIVGGSLSVGTPFGGPAGQVRLLPFGVIGTTSLAYDPTADPAVVVDPGVVTMGEVGLSIDVPGYAVPLLNTNFNNGVNNAYRLGSETLGSVALGTPVAPFDDGVTPPIYFLGGAGRLDFNNILTDSVLSGNATGLVMPRFPSASFGVNDGMIVLQNASTFSGPVIVEQEQLVLEHVGAVGGASFMNIVAQGPQYDGGNYQHGTIVLNPALVGAYLGPAPNLDGGALGFSGPQILFGLPSVAGQVGLALFDASNFGGGSPTSSLLALGGSNSIVQGAGFGISDLLSPSGNPIVLITTDRAVVRLTQPNIHTGGTAVVGASRLEISNPNQLGPGPLNIASGAELRVIANMTITNELDMHDAIDFGDSRISVLPGITARFSGNMSTAASPHATFNKTGAGQLIFDPALPWLPLGQENSWGLQIEGGDVVLQQLPEYDPGFAAWETGPLVLRSVSTILSVTANTQVNATNYGNAGFRVLNADANSFTTVDVALGSELKLAGVNSRNQIFGQIDKTGQGVLWLGGDSSGGDAVGSRYDGRGDLNIIAGTVRIGNHVGTDDAARAFPDDVVLRIQDQATLIKEQDQPGRVQSLYINDQVGGGVAEMILFGGGPLGDGSVNVDLDQHGTFEILGSLNKLGNSPLRFRAQPGATIAIGPGATLEVNDGTVEVDGSGIDPFTDTILGNSLAVISNSVTDGFRVTAGNVRVSGVSGLGRTRVEAGAKLDVVGGLTQQEEFEINGEIVAPAMIVGQLLTGNGLVTGDVSLNGAALAPNEDVLPAQPTPATLKISGNLSAGPADEVNIDVDGTTGTFDFVDIGGTAALAGATLTLDPHSHFPSLGVQTYVVLSAGGGVLTPFGTTPNPGDYLGFGIEVLGVNYGAATVEIDLEQIAYADFNDDGVINAVDLATWSSNYSIVFGATHAQGDADLDGDVDGADFLVWQRQLGLTITNQFSFTPTNVPEPTSAMLSWLTLVLTAGRTPRRRCRYSY